MKIGIIGQGYVGKAIKIVFEPFYKGINTFDKYHSSKSTVSTIKELTNISDIIFVCLPTPMKKNGSCNTEIIEKEIANINNYSKKKKIVVTKSTITPGMTKKIDKNNKKINVIFNPEF